MILLKKKYRFRKCALVRSVQPNVSEHTHITSTQIKKQNIANSPKNLSKHHISKSLNYFNFQQHKYYLFCTLLEPFHCSLLCLASFTQRSAYKIPLYGGMCLWIILITYTISHYINIPHYFFTLLLIGIWVVSSLGYYE